MVCSCVTLLGILMSRYDYYDNYDRCITRGTTAATRQRKQADDDNENTPFRGVWGPNIDHKHALRPHAIVANTQCGRISESDTYNEVPLIMPTTPTDLTSALRGGIGRTHLRMLPE